MGKRKPFLFRTDPQIMEALRRWADDELRSVNGQLDFLVRRALRDAGRLPGRDDADDQTADPGTTDES